MDIEKIKNSLSYSQPEYKQGLAVYGLDEEHARQMIAGIVYARTGLFCRYAYTTHGYQKYAIHRDPISRDDVNAAMLEILDENRGLAITYCCAVTRYEVAERRSALIAVMPHATVQQLMDRWGGGYTALTAGVFPFIEIIDHITEKHPDYLQPVECKPVTNWETTPDSQKESQ